MGNRRRKMVKRKFQALPWNKHNRTRNTEELPEQKVNKIVEDNSVMLEKMNNVSSICDNLLQTFYTMAENDEIDFEEEAEVQVPMIKTTQLAPQIKPTQLTPEVKEKTVKLTNFKRMTKKKLIEFAKTNGVKVSTFMTKSNIIKAIEAKQ